MMIATTVRMKVAAMMKGISSIVIRALYPGSNDRRREEGETRDIEKHERDIARIARPCRFSFRIP